MNLFVFGLGFTGRRFAERARARFETVRASVTDPAAADRVAAETGFAMRAFGPEADDSRIAADLADTDVLLASASRRTFDRALRGAAGVASSIHAPPWSP